jgi:hypothetical protein
MISLLLITFLVLLCATQVTRTTLSIYRAIFEGSEGSKTAPKRPSNWNPTNGLMGTASACGSLAQVRSANGSNYAIVITGGGRDLNESHTGAGRSGLPRISRASARSGKSGKGREARRAGYGTAVKYLELIGNKLCKAGWSLGWVSAIDSQGRTIWIVDAHRGDGRRFIVHADEKLSAFALCAP